MRHVSWALLLFAGCSLNLAQVREELTPRAKADLECKGSQLEFEEVKQPLAASNVKVSGCGRSAEYFLAQSQWRLVAPLRPAEPPSVLQAK
ncbi:MAG: hypothetical protein GQE15_14290 [Archangiaceae bacterium]|nr:hypothetical protein [Archangiaceae bacterium]